MRISDWSSDVCSSDLAAAKQTHHAPELQRRPRLDDNSAAQTDIAGIEHGGLPRRDRPLILGERQREGIVGNAFQDTGRIEIGRTSGRERVCQYVYILVVAVSLKKKTIPPLTNN